jgi:sugar-phosphatase
VLVCAEDVLHGKPSPDVYLTAAVRLGVEPADCIVVEDAPAGIQAARSAGMRVIALTTTHEPAALAAECCTYSLEGVRLRGVSYAADGAPVMEVVVLES